MSVKDSANYMFLFDKFFTSNKSNKIITFICIYSNIFITFEKAN